jgi:hypothetical protein
MKKVIICCALLICSFVLNAQDGAYWGYTVKLDFDSFQLKRDTDSIVSIKIYENTSFEPQLSGNGSCHSEVSKLNQDNLQFQISKGCATIGGANTYLKLKPPTLYFHFTIASTGFRKKSYTYIKIVPIYFSTTEANGATWSLNAINLKNHLQIDALPIAIKVNGLEDFEIIEPKSLDIEVFSLIELRQK